MFSKMRVLISKSKKKFFIHFLFSFISSHNLDSVLTEKDKKKKKINSLGEKSVVRCVFIYLFITFFFFLILLLLLLLPCIFHLDFLQIIVFIWNNFLFGVCFFSAVPMLFSTKYNRLILSSTLPSFVFGLSCWVAVIVLWGGVLFCLLFLLFVFFLPFSGPLFFEIFSRYLLFVSFSIIIVIILFWDIKISLNSLFSF